MDRLSHEQCLTRMKGNPSMFCPVSTMSMGLIHGTAEAGAAPPQVRLMLLAALCGEHLLLLGPPGTAKSELSRRLAGLTGGKYYERLLTRFSVPEELFGPLSMRGEFSHQQRYMMALICGAVKYWHGFEACD